MSVDPIKLSVREVGMVDTMMLLYDVDVIVDELTTTATDDPLTICMD